jgi:hypothetical protein
MQYIFYLVIYGYNWNALTQVLNKENKLSELGIIKT